jgi:hypothetical protein
MQVLKFGGTSVANADNMSKVVDIVAKAVDRDRTILVVSAISGCTDTLIKIGTLAADRDESYKELINRLQQKHHEIIRTLLQFSKEQPELVQLYCSLTTGGNTEFLNQLSQRIEAVTASIYTRTIAVAQETGEVRKDINPAFFAYLLDNVFMMLQFSTACPYYKERFFIYTGKQVEDSDELIVEQTLLFLKAAFNFK